jgi:hypothetical protein
VTEQPTGIDDEWDEEISVLVTVRIKARTNPEYFEGWMGRTPLDLAKSAALSGSINDLERADGWADLIGEAYVVDVEEGY